MRSAARLPPSALLALLALFVSLTSIDPVSAAKEPPPTETLAAAQGLVDAGDPDGALRLVAPVLKRDAKNAAALLIRSTAECMLGELDGCRKDLDRALELDPRLRQGWLNRSALAIADQRWDDALKALARAETLDPTAPDNALNQGAVRLLKGELETASAQFAHFLEGQPKSADAWYLVASNYANAGYAALAIEHLSRAVTLDERSRVRARTDPNFGEVASNRAFQRLLEADSWAQPAGTAVAERTFRTRFVGSESPLVSAVLNVLQLSGAPLDPRVEIAPDWALFWAQFRIKLIKNADDSTTVRLFSRPEHYFAPTWDSATSDFFRQVEMQLLRLEMAAGRQPPETP